MEDRVVKQLVAEAVDLHFHVGPDILPRKYTVESFVNEEQGKIKGVCFKAHSFPTVPAIIEERKRRRTDMLLIGSVTLNYFMGGFNPSAIYASAVMSPDYPILVWFPTTHAENHLVRSHSEFEIPPDWVKDPSFKSRPKASLKAIRVTDWAGNLIRKAEQVLDTVKEMGCIVGTGHVSWQESEKVTMEALRRGTKVIVTHPLQRDIAMPIEVQQRLAKAGAFIEYSYIVYYDRDHPQDYPPAQMAANIKAIGPEQCILTSDAGQMKNPGSSESLGQFVQLLEKEGLKQGDFEKMLIDNPRRILGVTRA